MSVYLSKKNIIEIPPGIISIIPGGYTLDILIKILKMTFRESLYKRDSRGRFTTKLSSAIKNVIDKKTASIAEDTNPLFTELEDSLSRAKTAAKQLKVFKDFRKKLIDGGMSKKDAQEIVKNIEIDKSLKDNKKWDSEKIAKESAIEFYQLTRGKGKAHLTNFKIDDSRPYAEKDEKTINLGDFATKTTIFHEMGHHVEFDSPIVTKAARDWRDSKATNKEPEQLGKITKSDKYDDDEVAMRGNYLSPYVGKVYDDGYTEVVAMGLERFSTPEAMKSFYEKDKSHFNFILNVITN